MPSEAERLTLQHALLKMARGGNYAAPLQHPAAILDVACGTGQWCCDIAQEFPDAQVVGLDRTPSWLPPAADRSRWTFLLADALKPLPFAEAQFDFIHAQLVSGFVPLAEWGRFVAELGRVTRPGGYIELVDVELPTSPSSAFWTLWAAVELLMQGQGFHPGAGPFLAVYLNQAGFSKVQHHRVVAGAASASQLHLLVPVLLQASRGMTALLVAGGLITEREGATMLRQVQDDLPHLGASWPIVTAYGMRLPPQG